jgi:hypothetical protein
MDNTYKHVDDMSMDELKAIVNLIIELDSLAEDEQPEKQMELVTALQTLIRTEEAIVLTNTEVPVEPSVDNDALEVE